MVRPKHFLILLLSSVFPVFVWVQTADFKTKLQRNLQPGPETVKSYKLNDSGEIRKIASADQPGELLTKLPSEVMQHDPQLLGICDFDNDGQTEAFISWLVETPETLSTQFRVYRISPRRAAMLMLETQLHHQLVWVEFPIAHNGKKLDAAVIRGLGGGTWGVYYVMFPGTNRLVELGDATWLDLDDLDRDGTYEWILLYRRAQDLRCSYGFLEFGSHASIFQWSGDKFTGIWPPPNWVNLNPKTGENCIIMSRLYDMDDDGKTEIINISDVATENPQSRLSIYKPKGNHFENLAHIDISSKYAAVEIIGIRRLNNRKQIVLRLADAKRCRDDRKFDEGVLISSGYDFIDGILKESWVNGQINPGFNLTEDFVTVNDLDNDGEDEMIFAPGEDQSFPPKSSPKKPMILKGVKDFLPYSSK